MKKDSLLKTLEDLGLTENESRVYFASLSLGSGTIQKIANVAEIKRTTAYGVVESLQKIGLIKVEVRGFKKVYSAESPERLERIIEQKKERLQNQLPDLLSLHNQKGGESFIKYYEGKEAVKSVYESNIRDIKPGEEYMVVSHSDKVFDIYGEWFTRFVERRSKLNINIRMLG